MGSAFFPLTHSAPWRSVLQLSKCCSHSDKELAGISVTSSTSALTDLPGAAWLTSPRYQRTGRAHSSYTMLLFLLMRIPLNWTIIPTLFKVAFMWNQNPFSSKVRQHHTEPSYSSVSLIGPLLSNRLDDTGWLAKGREWHALGREQMGV